jgi:hypothetical protein
MDVILSGRSRPLLPRELTNDRVPPSLFSKVGNSYKLAPCADLYARYFGRQAQCQTTWMDQKKLR